MQYDVICIGAGQANPGVAVTYASDGKRAALIEGDKLGGTCLNYGCRPTKTLRASARVAYLARRGAEFGINTTVEVDFQAVMARKNRIIGGMQTGTSDYFHSVENLDIYKDYAQFIGKEGDHFQVQVGDQVLEAPEIYLNTGTRPFIPPIEGIDSVTYLTNEGLLDLQKLPDHLVIIGGGYIGLEFGQMFRRFGSDVTIIETAAHIASREDRDVSDAIEDLLREEGVTILTQQRAQRVQQSDDGSITLTLQHTKKDETTTITGSHLLVATGRRPNTDTLNLDAIGLETDARGYIETDGHFQTAVPGVWALGDINKRGAFTHTSYQDYEIWLANHQGQKRSADGRIMAYSMFTDPPCARVGMNEREARESGRNILMAKYHMADVSRAQLDSELHGLIKILVDEDTEEIVGGLVMGMQGDDVLQIISTYMHTGASYKIMRDALPVHPTVAEFFPTILGMLKPLSEWD